MKAVVALIVGTLLGVVLTLAFVPQGGTSPCSEAIKKAEKHQGDMAQALAVSGNLVLEGIRATTTALDKDYDGVTAILTGMEAPSTTLELLADEISLDAPLVDELFAECKG